MHLFYLTGKLRSLANRHPVGVYDKKNIYKQQ